MEITIHLRNTLNGQEKEVALPTSLESIKARFGLDETDDYDNLVIVDSSVEFIGENDSLDDVLDFSRLVEVVEVDGTNRFGTGYYTVEELEALNQIAEGYY